jgi:hypothetical protein
MQTKTRQTIDSSTVISLAQEFATERLTGLPGGQTWFQAFKRRGEKIARQHGQSWAELYARIHREAYAIISEDPRSLLSSHVPE